MRHRLLLAFMALPLVGCSEGQRLAPSVEERDSSGVAFLIHSTEAGQLLRVEDSAEVVVGTPSDGTELFRVRGGVLLPGNALAIANSGTNEVLFFGPNGELVCRVGGEGEGPEEFKNILWIQNRGDGEVSVYDAGNLRVNRYGRSGELITSKPVRLDPEDPPSENAMVGRGFHLGLTSRDHLLSVPWPAAILDGVVGIIPLEAELRNYSPDLSDFVVIDTVQLRTWYEAAQPEGPPIEQVFEAPVFVFSANRNRLAYSEADAHRIVILEDGVPVKVIVEERPRIPFRPDSIPPYLNHHADSLPAYRLVQVDGDGRVWAQPPTTSGQTSVRWRVFSADGRSKSEIDLPVSSAVLDALGDRLLLLERDSLDVETVVVRVTRGAF